MVDMTFGQSRTVPPSGGHRPAQPARARPGGAARGGRRWRPRAVGGAADGLSLDPPPALLEPPGDEPCRQAPQAPPRRVPRSLPGALSRPHPSHLRGARDELARWLHERGQDPAAETLYRDWDDFVTFYDFPAKHWLHLRTSNPIESFYAGVRLRTDVAKRARIRENALYLVFKIVQRLGLQRRDSRSSGTERGGSSGLINEAAGRPRNLTRARGRPRCRVGRSSPREGSISAD